MRVLLVGWATFFFFAAGPLIAFVLLPLAVLGVRDRDDRRRRATRVLGWMHAFVWRWIRRVGLVDGPSRVPELPAIAQRRPYLLVSNHPSLIDAVLFLGAYEGLTCVVKPSWYRSLTLGSLLRQSAYLPAPDRGAAHDDDGLGRMIAHIESGHPLLVFPEGTRSDPEHMHRFRGGAVAAAIGAGAPIVAIFVATDRPFLTKGGSVWRVPDRAVRYQVDLLDVIDTRGVPMARAREINAELQARYHARFAESLASRAASA